MVTSIASQQTDYDDSLITPLSHDSRRVSFIDLMDDVVMEIAEHLSQASDALNFGLTVRLCRPLSYWNAELSLL